MYELLKNIAVKPEAFSRYTALELWTRPYLAQQMLKYHLNQEIDLASRKVTAIDSIVNWIDTQVGLDGKSLCDLGCGPGLYAQRFALKNASVTGVDFSENSLSYAKKEADKLNIKISYLCANYLSDELPSGYDIITLIYTDLCALSPDQRLTLLSRMRGMLNDNGKIIIDVASTELLKDKEEATVIEDRLMGGFWAEGDYVGIQRSFIYKDQDVSLDRYLIVEPNETWEIFNWFQYFTPESLKAELKTAGFVVEKMTGGLSGDALTDESPFIGVIATVE